MNTQKAKLKVYRASAGSGKTFQLTVDYLSIIFTRTQPEYFAKILAITFTNKATHELKERIIQTLILIANSESDAQKNAIATVVADQTGLSFLDLHKKGKAILRHVLHRYGEFNVSTIDRFTHQIVRTFSRDMQLPDGFEIELDQNKYISLVVNRLLEKIGSDQELTEALITFSLERLDDDQSWDLRHPLSKFIKRLMSEDSWPFLQRLDEIKLPQLKEAKLTIESDIKRFKAEMEHIGSSFFKILELYDIPLDYLPYKGGGIAGYFTKLQAQNLEAHSPTKRPLDLMAKDSLAAKSANDDIKEQVAAAESEIRSLFQQAVELSENQGRDTLSKNLVLNSIHLLSLTNAIKETSDEVKAEEGILPIAELNTLVTSEVKDEPVPYIYERIGQRFHHYIVDEFQDTSVMQWKNLMPLVEEGLATENVSILAGDEKQAIYRWRGGEAGQFANITKYSQQYAEGLIEQQRSQFIENYIDVIPKKENYRSHPEIIAFNTKFFQFYLDRLASEKSPFDLREDFLNFDQIPGLDLENGLVETRLVTDDALTYDEEFVAQTWASIQESIVQGFKLGDITILTRSNRHSQLLAQFLMAQTLNGQPVQVESSESLMVASDPVVNAVIMALQAQNFPNSKMMASKLVIAMHRAKLIDSPYSILEKINDKKFQIRSSIWELLPSQFISPNAQSNLYHTVTELFQIFGLTELNQRQTSFLEFVKDFQTKNGDNRNLFIEEWEVESNKLSITATKSDNAVQIMTIHKAKGLQFEAVILPFLNWKKQNTKQETWVTPAPAVEGLPFSLIKLSQATLQSNYADLYKAEEKQSQLDTLNVLYVALTRAVKKMTLIYSDVGLGKIVSEFAQTQDQSSWGKLPSFDNKPARPVNFDTLTLNQKSRFSNQLASSIPTWADAESYLERRQHGILIHQLLAQCSDIKTLKNNVQQMVATAEISQPEHDLIYREAEAVLASTHYSDLLAEYPLDMSEREMVINDGKTIRPDKVLLNSNRKNVVVIDFKTGKQKAEHAKQVQLYAQSIKSLGMEVDKILLIYTLPLTFKEIPLK